MISPPLALPIDAHLPQIAAAVRGRAAVIIKAAPGAGKTTRVPPTLLDTVSGKIIVLEPRRLAARLSAERVAGEMGEDVGQTIGYQIRFDAKTSAKTRVVFVTEGLFLRMVLDQPDLPGIGAVVLDEFHERHMHTDLALAITRRLQASTRPDLKLIVMSATLDTAALETYLRDAVAFDVEGRVFPVVIEYFPSSDLADSERGVADAVQKMLQDGRCTGHILVFLTGTQEIRRAAELLTRLLPRDIDVLPLSADLAPREQAKVFQDLGRRKVILATNVAETSLTIPGVTGVIDAGRAKIAGHASWSGMPTLDIKRISQASCIQRTGRAGRTSPGLAFRLFSESDYLGRAPFTIPDIRRLDFTETYLDVLALTASTSTDGDITIALPWLEAPDPKAVEQSRQLLMHLGALDLDGKLTALGKRLAKIPLHPRLGAIIAYGQDHRVASHALLAACLISEGMILGRGAAYVAESSDVAFQMGLVLKAAGKRDISPMSLRQAVDPGRVRQVLTIYDNLARRQNIPPLDLRAHDLELDQAASDAVAACLLAGFPDRVAAKRELQEKDKGNKGQAKDQHLFNFCMGRGGVLADTSVVRQASLIVAIDASESAARTADRGTMIWVAAEIKLDQLKDGPAATLLSRRRETLWSDEAERVDIFERTFYGQIVVQAQRAAVSESDAAVVEELLRSKLAERWPKPFADDSDLVAFHERAGLILAQQPDLSYPRFEGEMLELLQAAICEGKRSFRDISTRSLSEYLEEQLPYDLVTRLRELTPLEVHLSNGRRLKVTYEPGRPPFVTGHIQDFYGVKASPTLMRGAVTLTVHLLGPNKRPLQVTADLPGFWQRVYPTIRNELSRNYPRHNFPEDPMSAAPVLHKPRNR